MVNIMFYELLSIICEIWKNNTCIEECEGCLNENICCKFNELINLLKSE